ncbi:hypothetical protein C7460_107158 [Marinoscillum furvescens DSM 4134]|uniref:Uncharacterized protein n=2 Tax=Marinoscillum furvescens TaxID=1026 RepID=A0A3D9L3L2_MARFU|nr:hypothetical protein C7460_107158 [Marinoscillum furvescens DSM 4134]
MRIVLLTAIVSMITFSLQAQEEENIVEVIDELTVQWDALADQLKTYEGLEQYCHTKAFRDNAIALLDDIHHYDTTLYLIVKNKFDTDKDAEARATLSDIETLETEYTTRSFLRFLRKECMELNNLEMNKTSDAYAHDVKVLEKEMKKYLKAITRQVDVIDDHVHHLDGL